jgi:hypothetical protein
VTWSLLGRDSKRQQRWLKSILSVQTKKAPTNQPGPSIPFGMIGHLQIAVLTRQREKISHLARSYDPVHLTAGPS